MAKRQRNGDSPDTRITSLSHNATEVLEDKEWSPYSSKLQAKSSKQRITVQISAEVIERVKNAVYWTPGLTLASLAEQAFSKAVNALENERKVPFPQRKEELKTGRPIN